MTRATLSLKRLDARWIVVIAATILGLAAVRWPVPAAAVCVALIGAAIVALVWSRLPSVALTLVGVCLVGYAFLGRGFAYVGVPPLFIGEISLGLGLLALWRVGRVHLVRTRPLLFALGVFLLIGLLNTVPYVGQYGINALRDAAAWLYGLFAIVVATLVLQLGRFEGALRAFTRLLPWFLALGPLGLVLFRLAGNAIPSWPMSGTPILAPKGGDIAVHLAGIGAFLLLGLHRAYATKLGTAGREWLWWALWLIGCLSTFTGRAALVTVAVGVLVVMLVRPGRAWLKPLYLSLVLLTCGVAFDMKVNLGVDREVSVQGLLLNVESLRSNTGTDTRDGSRTWRLEWWNDIVNYTVFGPYFWTGKGYGINLADADGFQVTQDSSLRNPHSGHLMFLARSGVPGFVAWVGLQIAFAVSLVLAALRARRAGQLRWASINVFLLAYWAAFLTNAAFDVYLEGPQGGIWFWSVFGFGLAALELQRRSAWWNAATSERTGA
ncbi:O-antigen ligase family protein [Deinococcus yavapaiensis]|uniref:O-antigen ligase-like membrane protein n=1 Tax=Deinococcus yavapaiensis KR-236 TaxID=694435 RepID=A0A318SM24_9DEIO|nr:O-antigen ligase family protein [Deinococcus yavapaiensis]PYE55733.1 O-antigen ligase-like membrane protein [Deinococcus yavapaiensis KR-236]